MFVLDALIVIEVHIALRIVVAFAGIGALFSACIAIIRLLVFEVRQAKHTEIKIINFYINIERFRRSKSSFSRKPVTISKNTKLHLIRRING